jgi:hypothetical protein
MADLKINFTPSREDTLLNKERGRGEVFHSFWCTQFMMATYIL